MIVAVEVGAVLPSKRCQAPDRSTGSGESQSNNALPEVIRSGQNDNNYHKDGATTERHRRTPKKASQVPQNGATEARART